MANNDDDFEDRREGITRYVLWALALCLAVGAFLCADGFFDEMTERTTDVPG